MPTVVTYIKNEIYEDLVLDAKARGISVSKLIALIVETYYYAKREGKLAWQKRGSTDKYTSNI